MPNPGTLLSELRPGSKLTIKGTTYTVESTLDFDDQQGPGCRYALGGRKANETTLLELFKPQGRTQTTPCLLGKGGTLTAELGMQLFMAGGPMRWQSVTYNLQRKGRRQITHGFSGREGMMRYLHYVNLEGRIVQLEAFGSGAWTLLTHETIRETDIRRR